jgi:hypothetical protein
MREILRLYDTFWRTPIAPSILAMLQRQPAGRLQRPQRQPPSRRVLLLEDVTCDCALCEASATGGGFGTGGTVEEMRAIEGHGDALEIMGSGFCLCLRALAGACRHEVVDMLTGGGPLEARNFRPHACPVIYMCRASQATCGVVILCLWGSNPASPPDRTAL